MSYLDVPKRTRARCHKAANEIDGIPASSTHEEIATAVIAALGGNGTVFQLLDERPQWFFAERGNGHSNLRQIRNCPNYGPRMYASFRH